MTTVEHSVVVDVPVRAAYDQWTQFEEFPHFMHGVEEVRQLDDTTLAWKAEIGGVSREWTARITEQSPDQRIAWTSTDGADNGGVVTFHALADDKTRVMLQLEFNPDGFVEKVGDALGFVERRAEDDLERFKLFIEERRTPTGAWRGEVERTPR